MSHLEDILKVKLDNNYSDTVTPCEIMLDSKSTKTILFQGQTYEAPDWAKWITQDADGTITVFELEPSNYYADNMCSGWMRKFSARDGFQGRMERLCIPEPEMICEELP